MLRLFAFVALGFIIAVVGLTLAWPSDESPAGPGHRAALGAIVGAGLSLPTTVLAVILFAVADWSHAGTFLELALIPGLIIGACALAGILLPPRTVD